MSEDPRKEDVLNAMGRCNEQWGLAKTTLDDIARESGVSRASLYRIFPGGRPVIVEAFRAQQRSQMSPRVRRMADAYRSSNPDATMHGLLALFVSLMSKNLRKRGPLLELFDGAPELLVEASQAIPSAIDAGVDALSQVLTDDIAESEARRVADIVMRLVISHRIAPSDHVDLTNEQQALAYLEPLIPIAHRAPTAFQKE